MGIDCYPSYQKNQSTMTSTHLLMLLPNAQLISIDLSLQIRDLLSLLLVSLVGKLQRLVSPLCAQQHSTPLLHVVLLLESNGLHLFASIGESGWVA